MQKSHHVQLDIPAPPNEWLQAAADSLAEAIAARIAPTATPAQPETAYLSVPEAAEVLRCRPQRIYDLLSRGRLSRYRDGSRVLLSRSELEQYLQADAVRAR